MERRIFGKTGLSVSVLGYGAAPIGYLETDQARVENILRVLLDAGVTFIDTAASYPGSEEALGKALAGKRDQVVLVSKCGQSFEDLPGTEWSAELITATVDRSLRRLKTDYLDAMLLHSCDLDVLKRGEALGALVKAREAGKIRFAGYSGDNDAALFAVQHPEVAVLETSVNICDQANVESVLPAAQKANIGVIAKRPIANSAWKPLTEQKGLYQDYAKPYRDRLQAMGVRPQDIGFGSEEDWPEIALRFTVAQPGVHTAIIGTTNPLNAKKNIEAVARGPLGSRATKVLKQTFAEAQTKAGGNWEGLT